MYIYIYIYRLIETYNMVERGVNLNNRRSFHRKILILFADNIGLSNY